MGLDFTETVFHTYINSQDLKNFCIYFVVQLIPLSHFPLTWFVTVILSFMYFSEEQFFLV